MAYSGLPPIGPSGPFVGTGRTHPTNRGPWPTTGTPDSLGSLKLTPKVGVTQKTLVTLVSSHFPEPVENKTEVISSGEDGERQEGVSERGEDGGEGGFEG